MTPASSKDCKDCNPVMSNPVTDFMKGLIDLLRELFKMLGDLAKTLIEAIKSLEIKKPDPASFPDFAGLAETLKVFKFPDIDSNEE